MFGIGLPELILIMAVALIVVGPDKLPELARTLAKQMLEVKKAVFSLKEGLYEDEHKDEQLKSWERLPPAASRPEDDAEDDHSPENDQPLEEKAKRWSEMYKVDREEGTDDQGGIKENERPE